MEGDVTFRVGNSGTLAIGEYAFCDCPLITSLDFGDLGNISIGTHAFQNCNGITRNIIY